ncbi:exported hypothetical protein [Thiomonas sp. X19]|uniref:hypothetical protein n=1 Tax=Thiomonas sp. X19 TaxID=1050370 RepID=UPI000B724B7E|nr:hypothetical protein [Thiomonas sp. X19]SCC93567.1 exported hypothetical protein [Thiomonas sp. X19]
MKGIYLLTVFLVSMLSGCASGPVAMGGDTYMMTDTGAWSWSSGAGLKAGLYKNADKFCADKSEVMLPLRSRQKDASFSNFGNAELQFKCLPKGDPELARNPDGLPFSPNVTVEVKNK